MTYGCGILASDDGLVVADTRADAGLDNIPTFRKLHLSESPGERTPMPAAAGNLSVGLPIDVALPRRGALGIEAAARKASSDAYFRDLRAIWPKPASMAIPASPFRRADR